jgi:hypothetical protein
MLAVPVHANVAVNALDKFFISAFSLLDKPIRICDERAAHTDEVGFSLIKDFFLAVFKRRYFTGDDNGHIVRLADLTNGLAKV